MGEIFRHGTWRQVVVAIPRSDVYQFSQRAGAYWYTECTYMGTRGGAHSRALTLPRARGYEYVVAEIMGKGGAATG